MKIALIVLLFACLWLGIVNAQNDGQWGTGLIPSFRKDRAL